MIDGGAVLIERLSESDGLYLWLVDLDRPAARRFAPEVLSAAELERFGTVRDSVRRERRVVCRAALRVALGETLGVAPERVALSPGRFGKPLVANDRRVSVSVSHSGPLGLISVSFGGSVGVDLELPRQRLDVARLAHRWFSPSEAATLDGLPAAAAADGFLRCWTFKEAVVKAWGLPLAAWLSRVVVEADPSRPVRLLAGPASVWRLCEMSLVSGRARAAVVRRVDGDAGG